MMYMNVREVFLYITVYLNIILVNYHILQKKRQGHKTWTQASRASIPLTENTRLLKVVLKVTTLLLKECQKISEVVKSYYPQMSPSRSGTSFVLSIAQIKMNLLAVRGFYQVIQYRVHQPMSIQMVVYSLHLAYT